MTAFESTVFTDTNINDLLFARYMSVNTDDFPMVEIFDGNKL